MAQTNSLKEDIFLRFYQVVNNLQVTSVQVASTLYACLQKWNENGYIGKVSGVVKAKMRITILQEGKGEKNPRKNVE